MNANIETPKSLLVNDKNKQSHYYIIQFKTSILESDKTQVQSLGAILLEYVPDYSFIARIDPSNLSAIRNVPRVNWVGLLPVSLKVSKGLDNLLSSEQSVVLSVRIFTGENINNIKNEMEKLGATITNNSSGPNDTFRLSIQGKQIPALAKIEGIAWIEKYNKPQLLSN